MNTTVGVVFKRPAVLLLVAITRRTNATNENQTSTTTGGSLVARHQGTTSDKRQATKTEARWNKLCSCAPCLVDRVDWQLDHAITFSSSASFSRLIEKAGAGSVFGAIRDDLRSGLGTLLPCRRSSLVACCDLLVCIRNHGTCDKIKPNPSDNHQVDYHYCRCRAIRTRLNQGSGRKKKVR